MSTITSLTPVCESFYGNVHKLIAFHIMASHFNSTGDFESTLPMRGGE